MQVKLHFSLANKYEDVSKPFACILQAINSTLIGDMFGIDTEHGSRVLGIESCKVELENKRSKSLKLNKQTADIYGSEHLTIWVTYCCSLISGEMLFGCG